MSHDDEQAKPLKGAPETGAAPSAEPVGGSAGQLEIERGPLFGSYAERMSHISRELGEAGALGLLLVDASALEEVEASYGPYVHQRAMQALSKLVLEIARAHLGENDVVSGGDSGADEIVLFFFRPRREDDFYREELRVIAELLAQELAKRGSKIVYPYRRSAPELPVGSAVVLHNPGVREDRAVREALEYARGDARLNAQLEARARAKRFIDVVLAEDVTVLYEPIVRLATREVLGYEALVRGPWDTELESPGALFAMAAETSLVFELDCLCRRIALRGARGLEPGKRLFLNCLPTAIHDPAFRGEVLRRTLEELRLRPSDVVFEISEKESIHNFEIFREARDHYADLGFKIALDDTGAGYGSLEAVMELSPDYIKVDLSLVRSIDTDPPRQELLRALHAVAGRIGAEVIAEGIETSGELACLQQLGIPYGQGYLFGRPAPLRRASL